MNFKINREKLYEALTISARAVASNSPVPILTGIYMDVTKDHLTLISSDANLSTQVTLSNALDEKTGLSVIDEGAIIIDSRYLLDIVKKIDSSIISIEILDGTLTHFSGEKAEFKINGYRPSDYPSIDFSEPGSHFSVSYNDFNEMISSIIFSVSNKETRPVLTGVHMTSDNNKITCTATDSFRLARKVFSAQAQPFSITVPSKCLNEVRSVFNSTDTLDIYLNEKVIQFRNQNIILQSSLLEGNYPETTRLIPTAFNSTMIISRRALISAIDRSSFIKTDNMTCIRLEINAADDILISSKSQEIGEYSESLTAESYDGMAVDISFSGGYLLDALKALTTDTVKISFTENMKPFIITNNNDDDSLLQLILPIRTYH